MFDMKSSISAATAGSPSMSGGDLRNPPVDHSNCAHLPVFHQCHLQGIE
jgi:hypothetical protein